MLTGAGRTFTWNSENQPVQIAKTGTPTETYVYDGNNVRIKRTVASSPAVTSIYVGKVEYRGTQVISTYGGVASRTTTGTPTSSNLGTIVYMHSDHLGSVSMTTSATGTVAQTQEFDPWGAVKAGGITSVSYNYTGQRLDGTGLLFYNARYYDPQLARFTSADSIVPNTSHRSLTVDYHENEFNGKQQTENAQGFWFQMSDQQRQQATPPWGPSNSQDMNRYAYVLNNPLIYTDPSGHDVYLDPVQAAGAAAILDAASKDVNLIGMIASTLTSSGLLAVLQLLVSLNIITGAVATALLSPVGAAIIGLVASFVGINAWLASESLSETADAIRRQNGAHGVALSFHDGWRGDTMAVMNRETGVVEKVGYANWIDIFGGIPDDYKPGRMIGKFWLGNCIFTHAKKHGDVRC